MKFFEMFKKNTTSTMGDLSDAAILRNAIYDYQRLYTFQITDAFNIGTMIEVLNCHKDILKCDLDVCGDPYWKKLCVLIDALTELKRARDAEKLLSTNMANFSEKIGNLTKLISENKSEIRAIMNAVEASR